MSERENVQVTAVYINQNLCREKNCPVAVCRSTLPYEQSYSGAIKEAKSQKLEIRDENQGASQSSFEAICKQGNDKDQCGSLRVITNKS